MLRVPLSQLLTSVGVLSRWMPPVPPARNALRRCSRTMSVDWLWWSIAVLLIVVGVAGTVLPALPGTALILAGIVLGAWIDGFARVGPVWLTAIAVLAVASWVLDYVSGLLGARKANASRQAVIGATIGTVVGLFAGLIGVLFLPLVGAAIGEYLAIRDQRQAVRVGVATWLGIMVGLVAKVVIGFIMIGLFIVALVF